LISVSRSPAIATTSEFGDVRHTETTDEQNKTPTKQGSDPFVIKRRLSMVVEADCRGYNDGHR